MRYYLGQLAQKRLGATYIHTYIHAYILQNTLAIVVCVCVCGVDFWLSESESPTSHARRRAKPGCNPEMGSGHRAWPLWPGALRAVRRPVLLTLGGQSSRSQFAHSSHKGFRGAGWWGRCVASVSDHVVRCRAAGGRGPLTYFNLFGISLISICC